MVALLLVKVRAVKVFAAPTSADGSAYTNETSRLILAGK